MLLSGWKKVLVFSSKPSAKPRWLLAVGPEKDRKKMPQFLPAHSNDWNSDCCRAPVPSCSTLLGSSEN